MENERDKVKRKVHALLNKTTSSGASEAEALAAAEKAGELMEAFDIQLDELQIRDTKCEKVLVPIRKHGSTRLGRLFLMDLAKFCDCKTWFHRGASYAFFGFPQDVEIAEFMMNTILDAEKAELEAFKKTPEYQESPYHGRTLTTSFLNGFELRISSRLQELAAKKRQNIREKTGTALVPVKQDQIRKDFDDLGLRLRSSRTSTSSKAGDAFRAGQASGSRANLNPGVRGSGRAGVLA